MLGKKSFSKLILFLVALLIIGGGIFLWKRISNLPNGAVVSYDGESFSPEKVIIAKGGKIIFINESTGDFWPASDFHPSNSTYPNFDPKKPIPKGSSWEFVFEVVGEWGYHDHLSAFNKGVIVVKEKSLLPQKSFCGDVSKLSYPERELCWYKEMKKEIQKRGISGALKLLSTLYANEPLFGQGCHDVTHLIGDEAYREFKSGKTFQLGREASYCGYGFYHGFIEAMLYTTTDYSEARSFCESLGQSSNAIQACYHGIGHSTFDIHDPSLWGSEAKMVYPAIDLCEKVTEGLTEEKTKQCATGVFNALGIAYSNNQYNLKLREQDPVWFCRGFKPLYKKACFIEVALSWVHQGIWAGVIDFKKAADFIQSMGDTVGEEVGMQTLASEYTRIKISSFDVGEMINNCRSVKSALFDSCMKGVEEGFFLWGKPEEEYKPALSFCSSDLLVNAEKEKCFGNIMSDISAFYSLDKMKNICESELDKEYRKYCEQ